MRTLYFCIVVALCLASTIANPSSRARRSALPLAYPARTMLFTGYFRGQHFPRGGGGFRHYVPRNYEPEGAMTAFAAGNTVQAAGSYAPVAAPVDCSQCNGNGYGGGGVVPANEDSAPEVIPVNGGAPPPLPDELPAADAPAPPADDPQAAAPLPEEPADDPEADLPEEAPLPAPAPPATPAPLPVNGNGKKNGKGNGNGNGGGKTRPRADDDDYSSEEDDDLPIPGQRGRGRGQGNFYNTYFPMVFGGRRGAQGPETPGVATAIANSFSQGRGAVATSHATAYGGPHMLGGAPGPGGARKAASRRASSSA